jgi:hypothetical protein
MTKNKQKVSVHVANSPALPFGRLYCGAVPTSAKQVELRARYEASLSLLDQLPDSEKVQKNHPFIESVT